MTHVVRHVCEFVAFCVVLAALLTTAPLPLAGRAPCVSLGVWAIAIVGWVLLLKCRPSDVPPRMCSMIPMLPGLFVTQYQLDKLVPMLGSAAILMLHVAGIVTELRQRPIPVARALRRPGNCKSARVNRRRRLE